MKVLISLVSVLFLSACGSDDMTDWYKQKTKQKEEPPVKVEEPVESLKEILNNFLDDCKSYGANTSAVSKLEYIRYGDPSDKQNPNRVGVCWTWTYDNGDLYKSNITVKEMGTAVSARALLYHELGHCVLGLDHTSQESQTLMSPMMLSDSFYEENWDKLVEDMCRGYK